VVVQRGWVRPTWLRMLMLEVGYLRYSSCNIFVARTVISTRTCTHALRVTSNKSYL
jgi:hypothetical protein